MEIQTHQSTKKDIMFSDFKFEKGDRILKFNVDGMKTSMLNGIRRSIINDICNIGFGYEPKNTITIKENTTALHDEYLAHRISLIPVMIPNWIDDPTNNDIEDYLFSLNVQQKTHEKETHGNSKGYVTTDHIKVYKLIGTEKHPVANSREFFPRDFIYKEPILITRFPSRDSVDQKLDIEFKLMKGTHADHASFSPVVVCVCYEHDNNPNKHCFMVESVGIFTPYVLVYKGIENLIQKCSKIKNLIDERATKYKGKYKAIEYIIEGESHTFGNMLQEFIYDKEFGDSVKGDSITHISYHEPHPLENKIIFRLVLKEDVKKEDVNIDDFESYKLKCNNLMKQYITDLEEMLIECLQNWEQTSGKSKRKSSLLKPSI